MSPRHSRGFTLIEVMVAMAILAGLSLLTAAAIKSAIDNRSSLAADINRDSELADAMRVIRSDISKAFHYRDPMEQICEPVQAGEGGAPGGLGGPGGTGAPAQLPAGCPKKDAANQSAFSNTAGGQEREVSQFIGEPDKLYFTALANTRMVRDVQESDQVKIGYFLKSCRSTGRPGQNNEQSNCLYRSISPHLDGDVTKTDDGTPLVKNVREFKLRYLGPQREEYVEAWKTGRDGDAISKENFPYAVEVTLTIQNKNDPRDNKVATQTILAPIHFPNNKPVEKKQNQPGRT